MKTVIEMVSAAGFPKWDDHEPVTVDMYERFAELVRADEREQLAQLADKLEWSDNKGVASAIRARGRDAA